MEKIKRGFLFVLNLIDNGELLKTPIKWLYIVNGLLPFILPIVLFIVYLKFIVAGFEFDIGWPIFIFMVLAGLILVAALIFAYLSFLFWNDRIKQFSLITGEGNKFIAIPVWAHIVRSFTEWWGLFVSGLLASSVVSIFICLLLTGFTLFENIPVYKIHKLTRWFPDEFFPALGTSVFGSILLLILIAINGYLVILIGRFISERILIKAQIANDVRDIGDIHRAATMPQEEIVQEPVQETFEETNEDVSDEENTQTDDDSNNYPTNTDE